MERFFFDLTDGNLSSRDDEGAVFATLVAVETEAIRTLVDAAKDARVPADFADVGIAVRNEAGETILKMDLQLNVLRTPTLWP
jgi:hypothetical protein